MGKVRNWGKSKQQREREKEDTGKQEDENLIRREKQLEKREEKQKVDSKWSGEE